MAKVGTAEFDVLIPRDAVERELSAASRQIEKGLEGSARRVEGEFRSASKQISEDMGGAARKAEQEFAKRALQGAAAYAEYRGAQLLADSTQAASSLAEQQSKANVVFGESAKLVNDFASGASDAFGQSERQALQAAGTFGNLFVSVGLAKVQSAEMSTTLTALGSDLASFNETSVDDALTALQAGLVGETEPLKRFGVNLTEATLKAKAMELGLSDGVGTLDAAAKAQAAYALILEQTGTAQGDFGRTSDSLANQQKSLSAEWENAQASLGEALLPAAKLASAGLEKMLSLFQLLPGPVQTASALLTGLGVAAVVFGPQVLQAAGFIKGLAFVSAEAAVAETAATTSTVALGVAAKPASGSIAQLNAAIAANSAAAAGMATSQTAAAASTKAAFGSNLSGLSKGFIAGAAGVASYYVTLGLLEDRYASFHGSTEQLKKDLEALGNGTGNVAAVADQFGGIDSLADKIELRNTDSLGKRLGAFVKADLSNFAGLDGFRNLLGTKQANADLAKFQAQLLELAESDPSAARKAYGELAAELIDAGRTADEIAPAFSKLTDFLESSDVAAMEAKDAMEEYRVETEATAKALEEKVAAAEAAVQSEIDVYESERAGLDTKAALGQAQLELEAAKQAAAGNSREYQQALEAEKSAERDLQNAKRATRSAEEDLIDARERAAESLDDLARSAEGAVYSEERAALALERAREDQQAVLDDPDATDREKAEAELSIKEADLALREAKDRREDSAAEAAEAAAKGVEGSDEVVAAKERLRVALDAQGDAEARVADAADAAAEILAQARFRVIETSDALLQAMLDEADQHRELAGLTGTTTEANDAYIASLLTSAAALDPASPVRKNLADYITDLATLNAELDKLTDGDKDDNPWAALGTDEMLQAGVDSGMVSPEIAAGLMERNGPGRSMGGDSRPNVTVNMTNGPSAREVGDEILWPGGR